MKYVIPILALIAGFAGGVYIAGDTHTERAPATAKYICPMHPTVVSDAPGTCPICNMDLVKKEGTPSQSGQVQIDPVTRQNIGVKTMVVKRQPLTRTIRALGRVDYDETRIMDVNSKLAGWVEQLYVDYTGRWVERGQPLLALYSPELVAAQEEYLTPKPFCSVCTVMESYVRAWE